MFGRRKTVTNAKQAAATAKRRNMCMRCLGVVTSGKSQRICSIFSLAESGISHCSSSALLRKYSSNLLIQENPPSKSP